MTAPTTVEETKQLVTSTCVGAVVTWGEAELARRRDPTNKTLEIIARQCAERTLALGTAIAAKLEEAEAELLAAKAKEGGNG